MQRGLSFYLSLRFGMWLWQCTSHPGDAHPLPCDVDEFRLGSEGSSALLVAGWRFRSRFQVGGSVPDSFSQIGILAGLTLSHLFVGESLDFRRTDRKRH